MLQLSNYLSFTVIVLAIVFALQLLTYKYSHSKANRILSFYMILIAIYFMFHKAREFVHPAYYDYLTIAMLPFLVSFNPFYYLYVKALTKEDFTFLPVYYLHFLPGVFLIIFGLVRGVLFVDHNVYQVLAKYHLYAAVIIYYLQVFIYVGLIIRMLIQHRRNVMQYFSYTENISLQWLWGFIIILIAFTIFDAMAFFTTIFNAYHRLTYWVSMNLFIIFLGYFGIKQVDIYIRKIQQKSAGVDLNSLVASAIPVEIEDEKDHFSKYEKSSISEETKNKILAEVLRLMEQEKMFQNPQITIDDLAEKLNINKKYISQVINEKLQKNFYQFVNEYRVECVLEKLQDENYKQYTIEALGELCGFHSRSSLISAFKKITGKTPSMYKRERQV